VPRLGRSRPASNYWHQRPASAPQTFHGAATLPASSHLSGAGTFTLFGAGSLPVAATLTAAATYKIAAAASLGATFGLTAGSHVTAHGTATLPAITGLTAGASLKIRSPATLPATFGLTAGGQLKVSAHLSVVTTLTAIPSTGLLTLVCSIASASGTDAHGNAYPQGLCVGIPLGPQVKADINGNLTVGGNLVVDGSVTNTALNTQISAAAAAAASASAQAASALNTAEEALGEIPFNIGFLSGLSLMPAEGTQGEGTDGFGGGVWTASQTASLQTLQGVMNNAIAALNALIGRLQTGGYMS
jgi:hypothetical protein